MKISVRRESVHGVGREELSAPSVQALGKLQIYPSVVYSLRETRIPNPMDLLLGRLWL